MLVWNSSPCLHEPGSLCLSASACLPFYPACPAPVSCQPFPFAPQSVTRGPPCRDQWAMPGRHRTQSSGREARMPTKGQQPPGRSGQTHQAHLLTPRPMWSCASRAALALGPAAHLPKARALVPHLWGGGMGLQVGSPRCREPRTGLPSRPIAVIHRPLRILIRVTSLRLLPWLICRDSYSCLVAFLSSEHKLRSPNGDIDPGFHFPSLLFRLYEDPSGYWGNF